MMKVIPTAISGVLIFEPVVFADPRGFFLESFNQRDFDKAIGSHVEFVQDNHSRSTKGVLRGLHYQLPPHSQGKLVRVAQGAVFDVAVDIRAGSPTFGRWVGVELSDENHRQLWLPEGMAHGFLVLSATANFLYKTTTFYAPGSEAAIAHDDTDIGIAWPMLDTALQLSTKDAAAPRLACAPVFNMEPVASGDLGLKPTK